MRTHTHTNKCTLTLTHTHSDGEEEAHRDLLKASNISRTFILEVFWLVQELLIS